MSQIGYEDIAKNQNAIEENFKLIKTAFAEIEKSILAKRQKLVQAIQKEQATEAAKLDSIIKTMKSFIETSNIPPSTEIQSSPSNYQV